MDKIEAVFLNSETGNAKLQFIFALCFPIFTVLVLGIDSVYFTAHYFDARNAANLLSILYFTGFFFSSKSHLRQLMLVMLVLSYIGELIFCKLLGMYEYRTPEIPLYVPFGHAIVYSSGFVYAHTAWSISKDSQLRKYFIGFFILLFLSVGIVLKDYLSLFFGALFFGLLKRKKWQNLYCFIAFCVIFIELVGTSFKCWTWAPTVLVFIPTSNPPMGAVFIYAGGDVLLAKIVGNWKNKNKI